MYWTHLIFVLLYGVLIHWNQITASKPGYLDFDNLPETNFSCEKKVIGGYYADVETGCQMFHVCTIGQKGEVTDIKFLCLNGTVFDQETRVCERIDEVDCSKSEDFFGLNLELYGNNANLGIQPENEFECEDCSTDDDYEESEETTTVTPSTTTTTTTTTTPKPTTTTTTTARPTKYQTSSQDTIAALLALHNAFNQGLQNSKVKPPPPRVINNAFSPTKSTPKPYTTYTTQRSSASFKPHNYNSDSQSFGSLNLQQQERPYYFTPTTERTNYHHFHSGDTSFGHSYDSTRPYNFQYFHARKLPEIQGTISVVTSTSTSTSIRTSKGNTTIEYPTGYEDYQDDIHEVHDSFFADVPKIRQKRNSHIHNDSVLQTPEKHFDKYYNLERKLNAREEFLQNLLGSIDMEDRIREKMSSLFRKEENEMEKLENTDNDEFIVNLGNKLGEMIMHERNNSKMDEIQEGVNKLRDWKKHFDDMQKDINLNYTFETNMKDVEDKVRRKKRDTSEIRRVTGVPQYPSTKRPQHRRIQQTTSTEQEQTTSRRKPIRQKIDTEKFNFGTNRKSNEGHGSKPVSEAIEDDLTTIEYRKTSRKGREQPRATTSLRRNLKFNYEATTAIPEPERISVARPFANRQTTNPARTSNHEQQFHHQRVSYSRRKKPGRASSQEEQYHHHVSEAQTMKPGRTRAHQHVLEPQTTQPARTQAREEQYLHQHVSEVPTTNPVRTQAREEQYLHQNIHESHTIKPVKIASHEEPHQPVFEPQITTPTRTQAQDEQYLHQHVSEPTTKPLRSQIREEQYIHEPQITNPTRIRNHEERHQPVPSSPNPANRRSRKRPRTEATTPATSNKQDLTPLTSQQDLSPDPNFACEGKVKGGFYADLHNDCRGFFICSQGMINGPLLKTHFWCGDTTKFNQRSRTCQAEGLVECSVSTRYFHLNNDFLVPASEDDLKGSFEPMKVS